MSDIKTILYATDFGKYTRPAFRMAVNLAKQHDAKIIFLYVIEPLNANTVSIINAYMPTGTIEELYQESVEELRNKAHERIDKFCQEELQGEEFPGGKPDPEIVEGSPAETILKIADKKEADLIVMGSHAHGVLDNLFIGSVADKVVNRSKKPVLLVPLKSD